MFITCKWKWYEVDIFLCGYIKVSMSPLYMNVPRKEENAYSTSTYSLNSLVFGGVQVALLLLFL